MNDFDAIDWLDIAQLTGARLVEKGRRFAVLDAFSIDGDVTSPRMRLRVSDNCGELNVTVVTEELKASVPLPGDGFAERQWAIAHRLHCAFYGYQADYGFGRDSP